MNDVIIIGAGVSGLSCGYHLKKNGIKATIFEKDSTWGGLLGNFTIEGFRFDRFVHFTFTKDRYVRELFEASSPCIVHKPESGNFYKGTWLRHPAQNNLFPLSAPEKVKIIKDFLEKPDIDVKDIKNYDEWLRVQYGNYFAENFPFAYTRKYWTVEPSELEPRWVGNRMHKPTIDEVLLGAMQESEDIHYYTKEMRYPIKGGFKSMLNKVAKECEMNFNQAVTFIDPKNKFIRLSNGEEIPYKELVSSLPLTEIVKILPDVPEDIQNAAEQLLATQGYQVSFGFNKPDIPKYLWFYIYDENILPARVWSPSLKSRDNVPPGCSSIQAEVFFSREKSIDLSESEILEHVVNALIKMKVCKEEDIVVKDIRKEPYANIVHTHGIYENRKIVKDYLKSLSIKSIGRFGEWAYLWSDQSFLSGKNCADKIIEARQA